MRLGQCLPGIQEGTASNATDLPSLWFSERSRLLTDLAIQPSGSTSGMWFHVALGHDRVLDQLTTVNVEFAEIVTCLGKSGERTRHHVFELSVVRLRAEAH